VATLRDPAWARRPLEVRINDARSGWGGADLAALREVLPGRATPTGVRVPKVAGPDDVAAVLGGLGPAAASVALTCLLESALGVEQAFAIATTDRRVAAIALGEADLASDLGAADESGMLWARSRVLIAARAAGLPAPAMSAWLRLSDPDGLAASCRAGRALGFLGRSAIHPAQLPVIESAFLPSQAEVDAAGALLEALGIAVDGLVGDVPEAVAGGAVTADGRFVDRALLAGAWRTLRLAARGRRADVAR
jgi:citrate lyase subunit beta/citryl-CoA lyase